MATPQPKHPQMTAAEFIGLRKQVGTQDEAADEMQTARRSVGRWERGERKVPGSAAVCIRLLAEQFKARREATLEAAKQMGKDK